MKNAGRHVSAFIAPVVMCIALPALILTLERHSPLVNPSLALLIIGVLILLFGLAGFIASARLFIRIGNGTIMPWDPTRRLIIAGLYRHVRNPMITSLICILVGEALVFTSWWIGLLALFNFVVNTLYFIYSEEPGLEKRFGGEYRDYKRNVPRWIPRLKPWQPR